MMLGDLNFTISSVHDDTSLSCRIYIPKDDQQAFRISNKAMIIAHPYAPLGGNQNDHVVLSLADQMIGLGFTVVTFNFRGARPSEGKTSWTGKPEIDDYSSAILFMIYFWAMASSGGEETLDLCLAGYSYGSQITSRLPKLSSILDQIDPKCQPLLYRAQEVATSLNIGIAVNNVPRIEKTRINDSYLLISPLLGTVSWLINLPFSKDVQADQEALSKFHDKPVFAIWGKRDNFTSSAKLETWANEHHKTNPNFTYVICNTSHFWQDQGALDDLCTAVSVWNIQAITEVRTSSSNSKIPSVQC